MSHGRNTLLPGGREGLGGVFLLQLVLVFVFQSQQNERSSCDVRVIFVWTVLCGVVWCGVVWCVWCAHCVICGVCGVCVCGV